MVFIAILSLFAATTNAQVTKFSAELSADQLSAPADPSTPAAAMGSATIRFDNNTNTLSWNISYSGLSGTVQAMHFHGPAAPGANGPIQVNIGAISNLTSPIIGSTVLSAAQIGYLFDGLLYLNTHTALNPAGEIRGQVTVIPTSVPTLSLLSLLALMAVLLTVVFVNRKTILG